MLNIHQHNVIMIKRLLYPIVMLISVTLLSSKTVEENSSNYLNLGIKDRFSGNVVSDIEQDIYGFIWIGTNNGLIRFDGNNVETFDFLNMPNNDIKQIKFSNDSILWLGSESGLYRFNINSHNIETLNVGSDGSKLLGDNVKTIFYNNDKLWIGTSEGLSTYDIRNDLFKNYKHNDDDPQSIIHNNVRAVEVDKFNKVWIGTYYGLDIFDEKSETFKHIILSSPKPNEPINELVLSIKCSPSIPGKILVGTIKGVYIVDIVDYQVDKIEDQSDNRFNPSNIIIKNIGDDYYEEIPIGTDYGFNKLNIDKRTFKKEFHIRNKPSSLSNNVVYKTFVDRDNNLWLGTDNGVSITNRLRNQFSFNRIYGRSLELNDYNIRCFIDNSTTLWLGTNNGVIKTDKESGKTTQYAYSLDNIYSISNDKVRDMYIDSEGILWVATTEGLNYLLPNSDKFNTLVQGSDDMSLSSNYLKEIVETSDKSIWVSSATGGVNRIIRERDNHGDLTISKVEKYNEHSEKSVVSDHVESIVVSNDDMLYMSHNGLGITMVDYKKGDIFYYDYISRGKSYRLSNSDIGLLIASRDEISTIRDNKICKIAEYNDIGDVTNIVQDRSGYVWLTSATRLYRIDISNKKLTNRYKLDKLYDIGMFSRSSMGISYENDILCGTLNGLIKFSPNNIEPQTDPKEILISAIKINNKKIHPSQKKDAKITRSIHITDKIVLDESDKQVEFTLTNTCYASLSYESYWYKLIGQDDTWIRLDDIKSPIHYSNLKSGKYTLMVSKGNPNQNSHKQLLMLIVKPAWYATNIAFLLYLIMMSCFIYMGLRVYILNNEKHRMKALNQSKLRFFTNISHEFKTPLTLIITPLEKILLSSKSDVNVETHSLQLVYNNALRLKRLVNEVIDFRKIDAGKLILVMDKHDIVEHTYDLYKSFLSEFNRHEIVGEFTSDLDSVKVKYDKGKIESAIINLITNAIKFTTSGGQISISIKCNSNQISISVKDDGKGIAKADQKQIFDRFYYSNQQADNIDGSGIGLSYVKEIVEAHKGEISLSSNSGKGSCFIITLNRDESDSNINKGDIAYKLDSSSNKIEKREYNNNLRSILLVDDDHEIRDLIVSIFSSKYNIYEAKNGIEALKILEKRAVSLIITDQMMPKMDGNQFVSEVRSNINIAHLPVIMLTAKDSLVDLINSTEKGVDVFVSKPFDLNYLKLKIEKTIETHDLLKNRYSAHYISKDGLNEVTPQDDSFLTKVLKDINDNINNDEYSVEILSENMNISSKQLYRKIKKLTDATPNELIRNIKLDKAKQIMQKGSFTISEIAYKCGFSTPHYFSSCFKKRFGVTPRMFIADLSKD